MFTTLPLELFVKKPLTLHVFSYFILERLLLLPLQLANPLLLGLLAFAGPSANSAIFSLAIAGQYTAYSIPILSRFLGGRPWTPGPFSLGRFVSPPSLHLGLS